MGKTRWRSVCCLLAGVAVAGAVAASAALGADEVEVALRQSPAQVVLYTLYRGPYEGMGQTIGELFGLAMQNGMIPQGAMSLVYLNNPGLVSAEHYLTEIRIPVAEGALQKAGTLGEFTDVKRLPAMEMAVVLKAKGVADPTPLRDALDAWVARNGYVGIDTCVERMLSQAPAESYAEMETEIMLPVEKLAAPQE